MEANIAHLEIDGSSEGPGMDMSTYGSGMGLTDLLPHSSPQKAL